jgi:GntR family transcriptional repressor for pyruvate dehydrogenase complex
MATFQKVKGTKIYEVVISQLKAKILSGELGPGDFLPPEKALAEIMGVSRASVREALKVLEFMGLIESKPGGGTNISYLHADLLIEKLNSISASTHATLLLDLLELREVLEPKIVELAIDRASDAELLNIEAMMKNCNREDETITSQTDAMFHIAIARASHNVFFIRLMETALAMLEETRTRTLSLSRSQVIIAQEHNDIVEPLKKRDKRGAVKAVKNHLRRIRSVVDRGFIDSET